MIRALRNPEMPRKLYVEYRILSRSIQEHENDEDELWLDW